MIQEGWNSPELATDADIMAHIASCRKALSNWRRQNSLNSEKQVEELKEKMDAMYEDDNVSTEELSAAWKDLSEALKAEEKFWKQKSIIIWLREGDMNSKFFRNLTKQRRARNRITRLIDNAGNMVEHEEGMVAIDTNYFRSLFETLTPTEIDEALGNISSTITNEINQQIIAPVTEWEVKLALFAMHPEKASGPDGMSALFYQKFWDIVKGDLTCMVNEFLFHDINVQGLNDTNICLIPKKDKPTDMAQFRPISLCNVSYKIISKVLCQRLKKVLPYQISETQSAFVAGRQIIENIMIAQEMFHTLRTKPGGREKRMAIKTDMSKAYDRMEWIFIQRVMEKMGFSETWINWIMRSVSSVKYHVLMNGQPRGNIVPHRGLRQGDPLSPFIFILCTEALVSLLNHAENQGKITGLRIARACPSVSHLLFADDSLFFCKAKPRECDEVMKVVKVYGKASGQCINFEKSSLLFGKKVPVDIRQQIKEVLGIENEGGMGTYLGIPEDISGSKCKLFAFLKEKLDHKINGWSGRWLTKGGKEILIKAIALALPTYVMSSFLLPLEICDKLTSAIARFWWSSNPPNRGMHWAKWEKLCCPKEEGGIGFRLIHEFNLALLAKQLWRLIQFLDSLLARVLRGRYHRTCSILRTTSSVSPSYVWTSLMEAKALLSLGIRRVVHSRYQI